MAGIEVAGLVLGAVPLIISALEFYMEGVSTVKKWRSYSRELKSLIRSLGVEHVRLENACEKLLDGIAASKQIDQMLQNPFGELWRDKEIHSRLKLRLWKSVKLFEDTVEDVQAAIQEMMEKLQLSPDGKVQWTESSSIVREFKRATFTLKRAAYTELLDRVSCGVSQLEKLLSTNIDEEPKRRKRSQGQLYRILRDVSSSLFSALRCALVCDCSDKHRIDLGLKRPSVHIVPGDESDEVLKTLAFQVTLRYESGNLGSWKSNSCVSLIVCPVVASPSLSLSSSRSKASVSPAQKGVKFSMPTSTSTSTTTSMTMTAHVHMLSATTVLVQSSLKSMTTYPSMKPVCEAENSQLKDICRAIWQAQKQRAVDCYGYICDGMPVNPRSYRLYPSRNPDLGDDCSRISLGDILRDQTGTIPRLTYELKLWLAVVLSSSVLQLGETAWLARSLTHDDIFFIRRNGCIMYREVFITKAVSESGASVSARPTAALPARSFHNASLFSLGVLLIELMLETSIDDLRKPEETRTGNEIHDSVADYSAAKAALNRIGESTYASAVRRCIEGEFHSRNQNLDDDGFRQAVYAGVVALIEDDLQTLE